MWAWVVGGIAGLILLCCCGIALLGGMRGVLSSATSSSSSTSESPASTSQSSTSPETTTQTSVSPAPPSSTTSGATPTSTSTTTSTTTRTTTPPLPSRSIPPTPAGSRPNSDTSYTLSADKLEAEIYKGFKHLGVDRDEISCSEGITLIKGRTARCTMPHPITGKERSTGRVEVAGAQVSRTSTTETLRWYLTFDVT